MSAPRILITRPADDAAHLAKLLALRGYDSFIEPLLHFAPIPGSGMLLEHVQAGGLQAVVVTSRHAVYALKNYPTLHELPLYAVGTPSTYDQMPLGFRRITYADNVQQLIRKLMAECTPQDGGILYVRGRHITHHLSKTLQRQGYALEEIIVYAMHAAGALSPELLAALESGALHTATFLSARTAETFMQLLRATPQWPSLSQVNAAAFSDTVAQALAGGHWKHIAVCAKPTVAALLDEVDKLAAAR